MPHTTTTNQFNTENFYSDDRTGLQVNGEQYAIVIGFFKRVMDTESTAEAFALDLFRVAKDIGVPVLTLLDSLKGKDKIGVNEAMAFYLNQVRPKSALLGVGNVLNPNIFVARNVVI
jgi:hypothetical protein